ncbi:PsiF family protein [Parvibium lacunae]|uniref:Phosphate-starvation-inducible protein PsiF n=1 Tax=Parvibium lacunae TaxID=1888893 RepID=A0A368L132_9BURK|nr:PsiF family protein [Parvibium lacunae]RCS56819.1 phosphate-starvation-inducible protein PsiF [Parvibium lacunae]
MKRLRQAIYVATICCAGLIVQPSEAKEPTAQQQKMADCNAEAKTKALKGDDRKAFMSSCLSNKPADSKPADGKTAQQQKMTDCNAEAKTKALKGDDRKAFMSQCLKKD